MNTLIAKILVLGSVLLAAIASAQAPSNPDNTIVRFKIQTQGTNYGTLDIELFDQEKPETVRNFLLYVKTRVFTDLVIHRAVSNFVIQAGNVRVRDPKSAESFFSYLPGRNYGQINNEYSVGPELSNLYGTIAMARIGGETNSASADWFINLNDNTNLDAIDGGFTVFGRVINTTGPRTGTNVLNLFRGITNITTAFTLNPFQFFTEMPYTPRGPGSSLQVRDLFTIDASVVRSRNRDRSKPKLAVQQPDRSLKVTTDSALTVSGTASDSAGIAHVLVNAQSFQLADGLETWSKDLTLTPGTNVIAISSLDWNGNESRADVRRIFYQVPKPITLTVSGPGQIIGITNQQLLDVGRNYVISAKPEKGNFFVGWTGWLTTPAPKIAFTMSEGMSLTAVFSTNYFPSLKGSYSGLITTSTGSPRTAGALSLRLAPNGFFTGKLQPMTGSYPIRGKFGFSFSTVITGARDTNALALSLQLKTNGIPRIEGLYYDGFEVGQVLLYRSEPANLEEVPSGTFDFTATPPANSVFGEGAGTGSVTVDALGNVTVNGALQDAAAVSHSTVVHAGYSFPIFAKWSAREGVLGWMTFNSELSAFTGTLQRVTALSTNEFETYQVAGSKTQ